MKEFKTQDELLEHYWSVIVPMARKYGIKPWECVRSTISPDLRYASHPLFDDPRDKVYAFAITVLEGKPVFVGDNIYSKETDMKISVMEHHAERYLKWEAMTWTPPTKKRTFVLNGVELASPVQKGCGSFVTRVAGNEFFFTNYEDRNNLDNFLFDLLTAARDKE